MDMNSLIQQTDHTAEFDPKDVEDNKAMGILAYISFLVLIPIFAAPTSKYSRYNASQGLVLLIGEVLVSVVFGVLGIIPFVGVVFRIIMWLLNIGFLGLSILGIVNVVNGKGKDLPIAGKIKLLK